NRIACVANVGPLSSIQRSVTGASKEVTKEPGLPQMAEKMLGARCFCPEGGHYQTTPDGKSVACSVHGSALEPRQDQAPAGSSAMARLMKDFKGMTASLTFLEDGLHAVLVIERK